MIATATKTSVADPKLERKKVLILGLGNDLLADDAVGLRVAQEIERLLLPSDSIEVLDTPEMGLSLLDFMVGYEVLILVDAVQTGTVEPGFLHEWEDVARLRVLPSGSPHFLGVGEVVALGQQLGLEVPKCIRLFAIEVKDIFTIGEGLAPPLLAVLKSVAIRVLSVARNASERNQI